MAPDSENGWNEYRRMVIDWHEQEVQDRKEIRDRLERQEVAVNTKLDAISIQLAGFHGERRFRQWAVGIIVPAVVSGLILGGEAAIAAFLR